jgi:mRNA-degrading endonuclease RelE of RelBE toxin-antitoxin system
MKFEIIFAPEAIEDFKQLTARERAMVRDDIERRLRYSPEKTSRAGIKRLRGISRPQFRLRIADIRVFYDITEQNMEFLVIILKSNRLIGWKHLEQMKNETCKLSRG